MGEQEKNGIPKDMGWANSEDHSSGASTVSHGLKATDILPHWGMVGMAEQRKLVQVFLCIGRLCCRQGEKGSAPWQLESRGYPGRPWAVVLLAWGPSCNFCCEVWGRVCMGWCGAAACFRFCCTVLHSLHRFRLSSFHCFNRTVVAVKGMLLPLHMKMY